MGKRFRVRSLLALSASGAMLVGGVAGALTFGGTASAASTIKIGMIDDATGAYGSTFAPGIQGAQAYVKVINAKGGIKGHKVTLKVYSTTSTTSGAQNAVRRATTSGNLALVSISQFIDGTLAGLAKQGFPVSGYGVSANWFGKTRTSLFSFAGDIVGATTSAWAKALITLGDKKIAVIADSTEGSQAALPLWKQLIPFSGGTYTTTVSPIQVTDSAALTAAASKIAGAGSQGAMATSAGGNAEIESALNQLGDKIPIVQGATSGAAVIKQVGASANGLIYGSWNAGLQHKTVPGVANYLKAMKSAGYTSNSTNGFAVAGYISTKMLFDGIQKAMGSGSSVPSQKVLVKTMNSLTKYTQTGMLPPVSFPAFHTTLAGCLSFSQIQNGKWVALTKGTFTCGKLYK